MSTAVQPAADITITAPTVEYKGGAVMTPMAMIDRALATGATPETLEKLMALQERWEAAQAKKAYDEAMKAAQAEMRPVLVNADNKQTNSKYATYEALDNAIRPIYTRHGFSLSFDTADCPLPDHVRVVCEVSCAGHSKLPHIDMPADGKGAKGGDVMTKTHATGAAVTYGRRYLLGMIFNITITKDDDGNSASGSQTITQEQYQELQGLIEKTGRSEDTLLQYLKLPPDHDVHTLTVEQYKKAKFGMTEFLRNMGRGK